MDNKIRQELDKIEIPEDLHNRVILGMQKAKNENSNPVLNNSSSNKKTWSKRKKRIVSWGTVAVLMIIFFSSALVSPTMAKVISSIPYLGSVFQSKSIMTVIYEELVDKGYEIEGIGIGYDPQKKIMISIKGSDYYKVVKNEVKKIAVNKLNEKGYDAYTVEVDEFKERTDYVLNEEENAEKQLLEQKVEEKMMQLDYKFDMVQVDPTENAIFINIVGDKKYFQSIEKKVEKAGLEVTNANHYKDYRIIPTNTRVEFRVADNIAPVESAIAEGLLSKKEYKVTGVSYKREPLTFIISTSELSSNPQSKQLGAEIEGVIVEFLKSDEIADILANEEYSIIVNSKDNKKIN
ncbi:DUF4179 domain-containing protein [Niallia hominis]|uniref:DUF4179 domain-containing protein n=1 Tax=Niallia hominis TaxID=3133173 RepID=A0ABV1F3P4_9BACI